MRRSASGESDEFKSAKWGELTENRRFQSSQRAGPVSDPPVVQDRSQMMDKLNSFREQAATANDADDLEAIPQIGPLNVASTEIGQLNR